MRFNSSLKVSLNRLILPSGYTAPLSLQKRKKHKLSEHSFGSCYLTFYFGGVTGLLDMISSCCFYQQLPKVSVYLSGSGLLRSGRRWASVSSCCYMLPPLTKECGFYLSLTSCYAQALLSVIVLTLSPSQEPTICECTVALGLV